MLIILAMSWLFLLMGLFAISNAYVNVALNKPAYQQYPYNASDDRYHAANAVDGQKSDLSWWGGQCAVSVDNKKTATWWVNLTSIHNIHHIKIYFRTDNYDVAYRAVYNAFSVLGFSVYVSNTTDRSQGTLCFKDKSFTIDNIPAVFTTTCPVHGQYVIYYNERLPGVVYPDDYKSGVSGDLCEVEVYACLSGFYGVRCNEKCGHCRDLDQCHYINGSCLTGCDAGYQGELCKSPCLPGFFGKDCLRKCPGPCRGCNNVNGLCNSGCIPGWTGNFCKEACNMGFYGLACNETCGHCRELNQCNHINGLCSTGCAAGYHGNMCKTPCLPGFFGQDCKKKCIETCAGCNDVSGLCDYGCLPGWIGYFCNTECDKGSYGIECNETCGHCRDVNQCSNVNGSCLTGCNAGYKGNLCITECDKGSYGIGCNQTCGHCRDVKQCSNVNGSCLTGCDAGFKGGLCKTRVF